MEVKAKATSLPDGDFNLMFTFNSACIDKYQRENSLSRSLSVTVNEPIEDKVMYIAIHKAAGLTVAGCSMILPCTIPLFHHSIPEAVNGTGGWNGSLRSFQPPVERWTAAL